MTSQATRILAIVGLMTLSLFGMIFSHVSLLQSGTEIVLKTEPVDPRSLFRGDYVILGYSISQLSESDLESWEGTYDKHDPVFITLHEQNGEWHAQSLSPSPPQTKSEDAVTIKGTVEYAYSPSLEDRSDSEAEASLQIRYGIESYFVPEGVGKDLEKHRNEERLSMLIAVGKNGRAAIKGLIIDDKLVHQEGLF